MSKESIRGVHCAWCGELIETPGAILCDHHNGEPYATTIAKLEKAESELWDEIEKGLKRK